MARGCGSIGHTSHHPPTSPCTDDSDDAPNPHHRIVCSLCFQLRRETYSRLTPTQRLQVARHPNRPSCLDIILNITDKFVELHGDRAGVDDPAIVCGIGSMDGVPFMFVGQQKGRNTKVCVCLHGMERC